MKFIKKSIIFLVVLSIAGGAIKALETDTQYANTCQSKPKNLDYESKLKNWYKRCTGKELNLDNPKTYNEKIQWLKLCDSTPLKTKLADKYLVRDYIKEKIGEEYLIPLLGVWDKFDDIDFDKLPNKFVLKCNHGSGWNMIVTDKSKFNKYEAKKKFDRWMSTDYAFCVGYELHYHNIKPKIIAEEYIESSGHDLYDYRVWCNSGKPEYIMVRAQDLWGLGLSCYNTRWMKMPFYCSYPQHRHSIPKPKNLNKLLELSKKLAEGFAHVRVDFYILDDGSIKFGELTFTSFSGMCRWNDERYNRFLGSKLTLPKEKYDYHKIFQR